MHLYVQKERKRPVISYIDTEYINCKYREGCVLQLRRSSTPEMPHTCELLLPWSHDNADQ